MSRTPSFRPAALLSLLLLGALAPVASAQEVVPYPAVVSVVGGGGAVSVISSPGLSCGVQHWDGDAFSVVCFPEAEILLTTRLCVNPVVNVEAVGVGVVLGAVECTGMGAACGATVIGVGGCSATALGSAPFPLRCSGSGFGAFLVFKVTCANDP